MKFSKKVLLIRPQNLYGMQNYPPLGLILLGSVLKKADYDVEILVGDGSSGFLKHVAEKAGSALFIGITSNTSEIIDAISIARKIRECKNRRIPIVWGGWHPTLFPEQMEKSDLVDYFVTGDGEYAILKLAEKFLSGESNLNNNEFLIEPGHKHVKTPFVDLNDIPLPSFDLLPELEKFIVSPLSDKFQEYYEKEWRWLPYQTSRGCPYSCTFCINPTTKNRKYRPKQPITAAREIAELVSKYNLSHIKIIDDNLFVQKDRVWAFFREIEKLGVRYTWDAECRIDYIGENFVNDEMFTLMKRVGLVQLTFGIESGSVNTLSRMKKGFKAGPQYAMKTIQMCAKYDISVRGSFILDIPGDTSDDIRETVSLIRELRKYNKFACGVHTYRPYPKSILCEKLLKEGKFYQPDSLEKWEDEKAIRQFTDTTVNRLWQANYYLSSKVSFYESLESAFWIKPHQLKNTFLRSINNIFIKIAKIRNNLQFYHFSIDKDLYLIFKDICINHFMYKDNR